MNLVVCHLQQANHEDCAQGNLLPSVHVKANDNRNRHPEYENITNAGQDTTCEADSNQWVGDTVSTFNRLVPEVLHRFALK